MQFFRNFFDIYLKYYANNNALFLFKNSFVITLIFLAILSTVCTLIRAFFFSYANLLSSKNIFNQLLKKVFYAKINFFE